MERTGAGAWATSSAHGARLRSISAAERTEPETSATEARSRSSAEAGTARLRARPSRAAAWPHRRVRARRVRRWPAVASPASRCSRSMTAAHSPSSRGGFGERQSALERVERLACVAHGLGRPERRLIGDEVLEGQADRIARAIEQLRAEQRCLTGLEQSDAQHEQVPGEVARVDGGHVGRPERLQSPRVVPVVEVATIALEARHRVQAWPRRAPPGPRG